MTDGFDLLAMAATIDEEAVMAMAGRTEDSINDIPRGRIPFFQNLWQKVCRRTESLSWTGLLRMHIERQHLTRCTTASNTRFRAFQSHGTVEMRYLSSQILDRPDGIEKLFGFINYFLMLPKLAASRQQIRYDLPSARNYRFLQTPWRQYSGQRISARQETEHADDRTAP